MKSRKIIMRPIMKLVIYIITLSIFVQCRHQDKNAITNADEMDGMEQAMQQEFLMTRDPLLNIIPNQRLEIARQYMESLSPNSFTNRVTALSWQERGPNNVGGRTRAILIDKRDATGNTVYAGSVSGGLFKTINFTNTPVIWTVVNDFLPNLAITCIVQDNVNRNIMYAGTGEGYFNVDAVRGAGVFKSTDGGSTWNQLPSTVTFEFIQDIIIDNNGNLYVSQRNLISSNRGVVRSTDGGTTWTQVVGAPLINPTTGFAYTTGRANDLEVASNGDVYATMGIFGRTIVMKSSFATFGANTGALGNWAEITPVRVNITQRAELAVAPSNPQRLYLIAQDSSNSQVSAVYRSINGGNSWDSLTTPPALNNGTNSQTWYNLIAAVDPNNADILVVGGFGLAKSTDGANTWTTITGGIHVDQHALVYNGSSQLLVGNDGGVYYSSNANLSTPTFTNKNNGYNVTQYYSCDNHPTTTDYFLAGSQDNGTQKFASPGINSTTTPTGGDGGFCHIDQSDGQIQITSNTANNYNVSTNGGSTFSSAGGSINNNRGQFINPTDYDDAANVLYAGDDAGKYYVINGFGGALSSIQNTVAQMASREVTAVKVDPIAPNTVWLGASFGSAVPMVLKISRANTASFSVDISLVIPSVTNAAISSIDVDPSNTNHLIVTLSSYGVVSIFESNDGGNSWASIEGNLPDMPIRWGIFAPANAQLNGPTGGNGGILLGTELGVWTTSLINGTSTFWAPDNNGLANVSTHMLKYRASDNLVVVATHGRGLFTTILPTVVTGVSNNLITKDFIKYISADNNKLQIVIGTLQTRTMTTQMFDMNGRLVNKQAGRYQNTALDINKLSGGVYILQITGDKNENFVHRFIKR